VESVGGGGKQPGSGAGEGLDARRLARYGRADPRGANTTPSEKRTFATGGAAWSGGTDPHDMPLSENSVQRVLLECPYPRGLFVSGNGDHALPHRYPLSTCTPNIRECEPWSAEGLALETRVLDGLAIGGRRGYGR
jgi:hypothetical protein